MKPYEYDTLHELEDRYWWHEALRNLLKRELDGEIKILGSPRILDAGCGTGGNLAAMKKFWPKATFSGVDASPAAVRYARERAAGDVHEATVEKMPFMDGSFDLVASMDVLYMAGVRQDRAMAEFSRVLKPGGVLALNLAAFDFLKGQHDMAVKTERRYTKGSVKRLLESAGLRVERIFYWNNLLFFPLLVWRPLSRLFASTEAPRSDIRRLPGWVNGALKGYLCAEAGIARRASLPFGVSVFALARKA